MKKIKHILLPFMALVFMLSPELFAKDKYALMKIEGSINPIMSEYIVDSISWANKHEARFIIIQLDTPGGLMTSMRDIIKSVLTSEIPVVVYAYPKGAQAASAGAFIMLASHVAVMSPGTEIGAMHPVSPMLDFLKKDQKGGPAGVMEKKVLNDTVAYAKSLAQKRGRNVRWAIDAVKDAKSSSYRDALRYGVIDLVAEDMDDLLKKLNNRVVNINGKNVVLKTANISPLKYEMTWKQGLLNRFADPQVVLILFIIAIAGIGLEFKNPGMIVPGAVGGVALLIFLLAIRIIPINLVGLGLIILAVVLFILELKIVSYGFLTLGGIISFVIGSMILFDSPLPGGHVPMSTILGAVVFLLAFVFIVVRAVINVHKTQVTTGMEGLIGEDGVSIRDFSGAGKIRVHGEIWNAESEENILASERVVVVGKRGMTLLVKKQGNE